MATHHKADSARSFFDAVWSINPQAIIDTFAKIDVRIRLLLIFIFIVAALSIAGNKLVGWGLDYVAEQNQPTLSERLSAPYSLEMRGTPSFEQQSTILEATIVENFSLVAPSQTIAEVAAELEAAREAAEAAAAEAAANGEADAEVVEEEVVAVAIRPAECLQFALLKDVDVVHNCTLSQQPKYFEVGTFQRGGNAPVEVAISNFTNANVARSVAQDLYSYTDTVGAIGNYVIVNSQPVNYFYSTTNSKISFTWSHENWVYTMTSDNIDEILALARDFPY